MPQKSTRFFKIILTSVGSHTNLLFPKEFLRIFGQNLKDSIMLNVSGLEWSIDLKRHRGKVWLLTGWPKFADFYSISFGYLLVFEYKGDSKFQVLIFDPKNERLPRVRSEADKARVLQSLKAYKPNRPFFSVEVHRSYLYGGSMTVPLDFIESNITKDSCRVVLQLPDGRVWSVKCYINKKCAKFSAGWKNFATENNLAAGDFCVFELVKERLLNVVIFRVES
ncbi:hypothetical protein DCAR_0624548 [Daucus carota subsp. sativus]|uniref:TF-B3 domain-containing protein n=1 Tax=Daucus carota subsp. sativus TaxID=79200 RepID=A0AAF1B3T3_DAUCS|nr:hypothetical protein DCAR_0624548 [Daucus carota subsp. sativus]